MNTHSTLKEHYIPISAPLLDNDFDLYTQEIIDLLLSRTEGDNDNAYLMAFIDKPNRESHT